MACYRFELSTEAIQHSDDAHRHIGDGCRILESGQMIEAVRKMRLKPPSFKPWLDASRSDNLSLRSHEVDEVSFIGNPLQRHFYNLKTTYSSNDILRSGGSLHCCIFVARHDVHANPHQAATKMTQALD